MSTIDVLINKFLRPEMILSDEAINAFDKEIENSIAQEKYYQISHYPIPLDSFGWDYDFFWSEKIEIKVTHYNNIKKILEDDNLEEHTNNISSIFQEQYYRKRLEVLNEKYKKPSTINSQFSKLYNILAEDIKEIKFTANRKDKDCKVTEKNLIELIIASIGEKIFLHKDIIDVMQLRKGNDLFDTDIENTLFSSTILNILAYINTNTTYKYNTTTENALEGKFTNKQLELVFNLAVATDLIKNDKELISPPKDYLRNICKRALNSPSKIKNYQYYFQKPKPEKLEIKLMTPKELKDFDFRYSKTEKERQDLKISIQNILANRISDH